MKLKELESLMQVRLFCGIDFMRYAVDHPSSTPSALLRLLQGVAPFATPKVELEQYPTGAHLASRLLYTVSHTCWCGAPGRWSSA
jgi:hypothetical protein